MIALETQFHIYLQWGQCPSRGLFRDCDIFGNLRITFVWSSTIYTSSCSWSWRHSAASPPAINDTNQWYLGEILGPRSEILEILGPRSPGSCYNCYIELLPRLGSCQMWHIVWQKKTSFAPFCFLQTSQSNPSMSPALGFNIWASNEGS